MNEPVFAGPAVAAAAATAPPRPHRSSWASRLLLLVAIGLTLIVGLAVLVNGMHFAPPVQVSIDGHEVLRDYDFGQMPPAHRVVLAGVVLIALLAALVIVPIALIFGALAVLTMVLAVVGMPLVAVLAVLTLLLSPLLLLGWLLWKLIAS